MLGREVVQERRRGGGGGKEGQEVVKERRGERWWRKEIRRGGRLKERGEVLEVWEVVEKRREKR